MTKLPILLILKLLWSSASADLAVQELSNANNLFAASLFKTVHKHLGSSSNKNFILSPLSVETGLAFIQSGSKGETGEEIRKVLHLPNSREEIEEGFKHLLGNFKGNGFYILQLINKMYVRKNTALRASFKTNSRQVYGAETENINFGKRVQASKIMNKWIEKSTKNKVKQIVDSDTLSASNSVVALSAFYLRANWSTPFPLSLTRKNLFYRTPSDTVLVSTMFQTDGHLYSFSENFQLNAKFLELPLRGKEASMVIILPNTIDGLGNLENQIDKVLEPQEFTTQQVNVGLPKFKIETRLRLKTVLQYMGMRKVFERKEADLSGIGGKKGALVISDLLQKIVIGVEEGGVEVAAANDDGVKTYSTSSFVASKQFIVDRPFLYYIKIRNFIACVGRVLDPTRSK